MIYLLIILALLSAYREVQILIDRGSWRKEDYRNIFWYTDWESWLKNFDSFHVINGLFVLVMILALYFAPITEWWMMIVAFVLFWWIRNIFMHIVFKKKPLWVYLWKI